MKTYTSSPEQIEDIFEPYQSNNSESSDIQIQEKILHGYHAAHSSCAILQMTSKTMQHISSEMHSAMKEKNCYF